MRDSLEVLYALTSLASRLTLVSPPDPIRAFDFYRLEDRILLDADGAMQDEAPLGADAETLDQVIQSLSAQQGEAISSPQSQVITGGADEANGSEEQEKNDTANPVVPGDVESSTPLQVVFVDAGVQDAETLLAGLERDAEEEIRWHVVHLSAEGDGVEQITQTLATLRDVTAVHVLSHGDGDGIGLGNTRLTLDSAEAYAGAIASWAGAFAQDGDLLIYGCDLASSVDGRALVDSLAALCDCDVAASDDLTGHASLGADWELEYQVGIIDTSIAFDEATRESWHHVLPSWPASWGDDNAQEWITNVNFGTINNTSGADAGGYGDYTLLSNTVVQGSSTDLHVTINPADEDYINAWVDWNIDGDFDDPGEAFVLAANTNLAGPHTVAIVAPNDATVGVTRMRVSLKYFTAAPPTGMFNWGEVEDYAVVVVANTAPTISNLNGDSLAYNEGDGAVVLDQGGDATVADSESPDFDTGNLTVSIVAGGSAAEDALAIRDQGTGAGEIGLSLSDVTFGGTVIGTWTGGTGGSDLVITFNSDATPAAVTALVQNITYENTESAEPTEGARTVRVTVNDGDGGTSVDQDIVVTVSAVNDAPVNTVPGPQSTPQDTDLVFSIGNGNAISVGDVDVAGNPIEITLSVSNGTLTMDNLPGPVGSETLANTTTATSVSNGSMVYADDGSFVVVWADEGSDGDNTGVFMQRYDADGNPLGGETQVNTETDNSQGAPRIAMDHAGNYVVVWQSYSQDQTNTNGVYAQRYNAAGVAQGGEFRVNSIVSGDQKWASVAMDADGDFVIVWEGSGSADSDGVFMQRYNAAGVAQGIETRVNTTTTQNQFSPKIAMDDAGNFVVVWASNAQDGDGIGIYGQRYDSAGNTQGGEFLINTTTTGNQWRPTVAMTGSGDFVVAWDGNGPGDISGVFFQRFNAAGVAQGGETAVNTTTFQSQQRADIGIADDGRFVIGWESNLQDGDDYGIYAREYDASGNPTSGEIQVNTSTTGSQRWANVAMNAGGEYGISFVGETAADSSGSSIQRYSLGDEVTFTSGDGISDTTITIQGTVSQINAALEGLVYTPDPGYNGMDALTITTNDLGNSGNGGAQQDVDNIAIAVGSFPNTAPTFGSGNGIVQTDIAGDADTGRSVVIQPDGKIIVAGQTNDGGYNFVLTRYLADGALDVEFGDGGTVVTDFDNGYDDANSIVLQDDGMILVTGFANVSGNYEFAVARYKTDGSFDDGFGGGDGKADFPVSSGIDASYDLHLLADGKILLAGIADGTGYDFALIRLNSNGTLDTGFGGFGGDDPGEVTTDIAGGADFGYAITVDSGGGILVAGEAHNGTDKDFALVRYNADGSLDTGFGGLGVDDPGEVTTHIVTGTDQIAYDIAIDAGGKILLGGVSTEGGANRFALARYNADGSLDTSLGVGGADGDGIVTTDIDAWHDTAKAITIDGDGKILLAGTSWNATSGDDFAVVRYNSDGTLDTGFGGTGMVTAPLAGSNENATSIDLQADGKIIVAGTGGSAGGADLQVVRFNSNGSIDTSFGTGLLDGSPDFVAGGSPVVLDTDVTIFDAELSVTDNFDGATLTISRNGGANTDDVFSGGGTLGVLTESGNLVVGGTTIGTVTTKSAGTLVLTFNGNATNALVNEAMQQIAYENTSGSPPAGVQIDWTFDDGNSGGQGTGGALQAIGDITVDIASSNAAPSVSFGEGNMVYAENASPVAIDGSLTVTDPNLTDFDGGTLTIDFTAGGQPEDRLSIQHQGTGAGQVGVSGSDVTYNFGAGAVVVGSFAGGSSGTDPLVITFNGNSDDASVQAVARRVAYSAVSEDPSATTRTVQFVLTDGDGGTSLSITKDIDVTATNDEQSIGNNTGATITEASTGNVITTAMLETTDVDHNATQLVYAVDAAATNGTLYRSGVALILGNTFTQADIDAGLISYTHDGSETSGDSFDFTVDDGTGTSTSSSFAWTVMAVDDPPVLTTNAPLSVDEDDTETITTAFLSSSDVDTAATGIVYEITQTPGGTGSVRLSGSTLGVGGTFTQDDLVNNRVTFRFSDEASATDFRFTVYDGTTTTAEQTFTVNGTPINDAPIVTGPGSALTATEQVGLSIEGASFSVTDVDEIGGGARASLSVASGTLNVVVGDSGTSIQSGNGTGTVTVDGTIAEINSLLTGTGTGTITYVHGSNAPPASTTLTVTVNDLGNTGNDPGLSGDASSEEGSANQIINITAVNDDPFNAGSLPPDQGVTEDVLSDVDLSTITLSDPDDSGGGMTVTLSTSTGGNLFATSGGGVSVVGNGSGTMTLAGSLANLNSFMDIASNIRYLHGTPDTFGDDVDTITVQVNDGGNTGSGGGANIGLGVINVDVTAVNDAPVFATNTGITITEGDTGIILTAAMLSEGDVDDDDAELTYTITSVTESGTMYLAGFGVLGLNDTFTQADIDAGDVSYDHDDSETIFDRFTVSLADGGEDGASPSSATFVITITPANDNVPVANNDSYTIAEDDTLVADWWDSNWPRRQTITFDNSAQGTDLVDFPVLVTLDSGTIDYGQTQNNGEDLRFFADDGRALDYDIEEWNESGTSFVWVKVPRIVAGSSTDSITMYYGNASASPGSAPNATWANGFRAVQHLHDNLNDASVYGNDGANSGSANATGQVADGQMFDGTDDFINLGSGSSLDDLFAGGSTVSAWINPAGWGENGFGRIFDKSDATFPTAGWALELSVSSQSLLFQQAHSGNMGSWFSASNSISLNSWQHIAVTYDSSSLGNQPIFYINGVQVSTVIDANPIGAVVGDAPIDLHVGNHAQATVRTFDGAIDDVRISDAARSADWVRAQYLTTNNSFITLGGEQSLPANESVLVNDVNVDNDPLTVSLVAGPSDAASFVLNADGSFTFTPTNDFFGTDSFTYQLNDGINHSNVATVNLTVTPINDDPSNAGTLVSDINVTEDVAGNVDLSGIDLDDVDAAAGPLTITLATSTGGNLSATSGGGVTIIGDGTGTLTLSGNLADLNTFLDSPSSVSYLHGTPHTFGNDADTISVTVNDGGNTGTGGGGNISLGIVNVDIDAVDDPPVQVNNNALAVTEDTTVTITTGDLLYTDADNTTDQIVYTLGSLPANGEVRLSGSPLGIGETFTQDDIDNNRVTYRDVNGGTPTSFDLSVSDGNTVIGPFSFAINGTPVNDPPVVATMEGTPLAYTENDGQRSITSSLTLADVDDVNLESASIQITGNYANGQDILAVVDQFGITGSWDAVSGTLTLTGSATVAEYQTVMHSITYENVSDDPSTLIRTVSFTVNDGDDDSSTVTRDITVSATNDDPVNAGSIPTDITVMEDVLGNVDLSAINLSDLDAGGGSLTVTLATSTGGTLSASSGGGVTVSGSGGGTLTLNGSVAYLNAFLDTAGNVQYLHGAPNTFGNDADSIQITVNDGGNTGSGGGGNINLGTVNVDITAVNDEQVLTTNSGVTVAEGSTGNVIFNTMLQTTDVDHNSSQLVYTVDATPANGTLFRGGIALAATDTFTQAELDAGLLAYDHDGTSTTSDSFDFTVDDGGGTTTSATFNFTISPVNDAPVQLGIETTTLGYAENDGAVAITSSLNLGDVDDTDLESAVVQISTNYTSGQDALSFTDQSGISGSWDAGTGTLTLTGTSSVANYEAALRSVGYENTSDAPNTATRTISFTVNDGDVNSNTLQRDIALSSINDDPTNTGSLPSDVATTEDIASPIDLSAIDLSDVDAGSSSLTLTLSTSGAGNLTAIGGGGVAVSGSGTPILTLAGTVANLNSFIDIASNITYLHATSDHFGDDADAITVTINDGGNSGSGGGGDIGLGIVNVDIAAINDSPNLVSTTNATFTEGSLANAITATQLLSQDVDDAAGELTYTITDAVDHGTMQLLGFGAISLGDSFTQAGVDLGNLSYDHNGSATTLDSFSFILADGGEDGASSVAGTLMLVVQPDVIAPPPSSRSSEGTSSGKAEATLELAAVSKSVTAEFQAAQAVAIRAAAPGAINAADVLVPGGRVFQDQSTIDAGEKTVDDSESTREQVLHQMLYVQHEPAKVEQGLNSLEELIRDRLLQLDLEQAIVWHLWDDSYGEKKETPFSFFVGTAGVAAGLFSIGYVTWALRGGAFASVIATSMPAWRFIDPVALLAAYRESKVAGDRLEQLLSDSPVRS